MTSQPGGVSSSAVSASRASAWTASPECLTASIGATLMLTTRTPGSANAVRLAVVKSSYRVPMPITTSASAAIVFEAVLPVEPMAPRHCGWS